VKTFYIDYKKYYIDSETVINMVDIKTNFDVISKSIIENQLRE